MVDAILSDSLGKPNTIHIYPGDFVYAVFPIDLLVYPF